MPRYSPNTCPKCERGSKAAYIRKHGACANCVNSRTEDTTLTGAKRKKALASIAAWLEQHPHPWDRANDGLFMGMPMSDRAGWP